jgi:DNA ligase (NAD+)
MQPFTSPRCLFFARVLNESAPFVLLCLSVFFRAIILPQIIREANAQYYGSSSAEGGPSLSDAEFDLLYQELQGLEETYPALLHKDSPTQRPGAAPAPAAVAKKGRGRAKKKDKTAAAADGEALLESAAPVAHRLPMLSLDSTTSFDKLRAWDASLRKKLAALLRKEASDHDAAASAASAAVPAAVPYTLELKYDGIAVSLLYRRVPKVATAGEAEFELRLERVLTRGTGAVGEDISRAVARWGRGVPARLNAAWLSSQPDLVRLVEAPDAVVEVRGEMMLSKSAQKDYADFLRRHGGDGETAAAQADAAASTPARNLASGLLRRDIGAAVSGVEEVLDDQGSPAPPCLDLVAYSLHFHHPDVLHVTDYLQPPPPGKPSSSSAEKRSVVPATQGEALSMLKHLGMPTSMPQSSSASSSATGEIEAADGTAAAAVRRQFATAHECASIEAVISELEQLSLRRDSLDFAIDGAVVKLADLRASRLLGVTSHHPKAMLAFKWAPKMATTTLRGIEWAVGRTPKLTPVALLEPVLLDGVRVGRANMHNASVVADMLPLCVGERVLIERRGDAIPHIVGKAPLLPAAAAGATAAAAAAAPQHEHDDIGDALELPSHCPACGSDLVLRASASDANRSDLLCSAPSERPCVGQVAAQMEYYASRGVMDLAGLGEASLAALREAGFLERGVADIVRLPSRRAELTQAAEEKRIPKFTSKRVDKLLDVIEERHRSASDVQFLLALGIGRLGPAQAKALVNVFGSASAVLAADRTTLEDTPVPGVGTKLLADFAEALEDARSGERSELVQAWREAGYLDDDKPRQTDEQQPRTKRVPSNANDETKATTRTAARTEAREAKEAAKEAARTAKAQQREAKLAEKNAARAAKLEAKAAREADKTTSRKKRAPRKPRAASRPEGDEEEAEAVQEEAALSPTASQPLRGMRVCILGRLASAKRADVVQAVKSLGGVVQVVCSRSTTHLLQGSGSAAASAKAKRDGDEARQQALLSARSEAMERGVPLLDEAAFHMLLSDAANKAAEADLEADKEAALEAARDEEEEQK